jgi:hypothetical protein
MLKSSVEPTKKRKRRSNAKVKVVMEQQQLYKSPYQPQTPVSPDLDMLLQAEIAREEAVGEKRQRKEEDIVLQEYQQPVTRSIMLSRDTFPKDNVSRGWTAANVHPFPAAEQMNYIRAAPAANEPPPPSFWDAKQEPTMPIIDMLPKGKQRNIYGIVSGLQGGIDSLQKQLTLLRGSSGIELEDDGAGH